MDINYSTLLIDWYYIIYVEQTASKKFRKPSSFLFFSNSRKGHQVIGEICLSIFMKQEFTEEIHWTINRLNPSTGKY